MAVMCALRSVLPTVSFRVATTAPQHLFGGHLFADIVSCTSKESAFEQISFLNLQTDCGLVQSGPLSLDLEATMQQLVAYRAEEADKLVALTKFFSGCDRIVCDISALGILAAQKLSRPAILLDNFRWDWIYTQLAEEVPQFIAAQFVSLAEYFHALYEQADLQIQCTPVCSPAPNARQVGLLARPMRNSPEATRRRLGIPEEAHCILISLSEFVTAGELERSSSAGKEIHWLVPHMSLSGATPTRIPQNVHLLSADEYHPDLVAASNVMLGKLGYSSVAEAACLGTPFAYLQRHWFPESKVLADFVTQRGLGQPLESTSRDANVSEAYSLESLLRLVDKEKTPQEGLKNDIDLAAELVLSA